MTDKTNITSLAEKRLRPDPDTVRCLKMWLKLAEAGEVQGVAVVGILAGTGGRNRHQLAGPYNYPDMGFGLDMLKKYLLDQASGPSNLTVGDPDEEG